MKKALFIFFFVFLVGFVLLLNEAKIASTSQLTKNNFPVIIIDAGHGGLTNTIH